MWLYGRNVIREVLKSGRKIYEIHALKGIKDADDILNDAAKKGIKVKLSEKHILAKITGTDKNQGIAANTEGIKDFSIEEFFEKHKNDETQTVAVLDEIEDPHNFGAIIRSCEVFGVCGIILARDRSAPLNDAAFKASSGAVEFIDIIRVSNINLALEQLKEAGFWIYGLDLQAEKFIDETDFDRKTAIVLGNEGRGLRQLVKKNCDFLVKIRQTGKLDSLNVSNAAAVAFHERLRKTISSKTN